MKETKCPIYCNLIALTSMVTSSIGASCLSAPCTYQTNPLIFNNMPKSIKEKIYTRSVNGYKSYIKVTTLQTYIDECDLNCYSCSVYVNIYNFQNYADFLHLL